MSTFQLLSYNYNVFKWHISLIPGPLLVNSFHNLEKIQICLIISSNLCSQLATHGEASAKISSVSNDEKLYQAPYARVSSLEDPCTNKSEYGKALPTACIDLRATGAQSFQAQVTDTSNIKLEKDNDPVDKSSKESTKGFIRLLKFGRKHNTSSERDSDSVSVGGSEADDYASKPASSSEGNTTQHETIGISRSYYGMVNKSLGQSCKLRQHSFS